MSKKKAILTTLGGIGAIAATGGLGAIGIPGLIGGGAAAGAGAGAGAAAATKVGMTLAEKLALGATAAQVAGGIYGAKTAGKTAQRSADIQGKNDDATLALERERDAEARRQWEADQQQKAKEFAAAEEERAFARQQAEIAQQDRAYQQQLLREKEQRAAPYRQMSQQALGNLGSLLGLDMSGSPLAQNLSAHRSTGPSGSAPMPNTPMSLPPRGPRQGGTPLPPGMQNVSGPMQAPTLGDLIAQQQRGANAYQR